MDRSNNIHGSWAHALHTAEMAMLYLKDADKVELINCHTLIGNGIWSSIFNSNDGYKYSQNVANSFCQPTSTTPQPTTNPFTLSALGLVMNQLGLALKDATSINEVTFGTSVPTVTTTNSNCINSPPNPGIISWRTRDEAGNIQVLFLNLTNNNIEIQNCVNNVFPSGTNFNNVSYQTFGFSPNDYFVGYLPTSSTVDVFNNLTGINSSINVPINNLSSQTLNISPYSITRAWVYTSNVAIKANTNQFCEGTEFMLTAITNPNATNFQWYDLTSGAPVAITGATSKTFYATAIGPSMDLQVRATMSGNSISDDINITVSNSPNITIAGGPNQSFCTGSTISLTANVSGGIGSPYYYNWTPSTNLNTASSLDATLDYALTENTDFTVYVSDGTCSSKNTVRVNAIGNYDFSKIPDRICSDLPFDINLTDPNSTSATFLWSNGATTSTFSLPDPTGPNYAVTATYNFSGGSCVINKSFTCNEVGCCGVIIPTPEAIVNRNNNVDDLAIQLDLLTSVAVNPTDNLGKDIINNSGALYTILVKTDFVVDIDLKLKKFNIVLTDGARIIVKPYRTLNLVDCILSSCSNGKLWDGIIVEEHGSVITFASDPAFPTKISNARNAIQLKDYSEYSIKNTSLIDNLIGMKFIGNSNYPNRSFGQISNVDFTSSTSIGTILPYYVGMTELISSQAFSGIDIENGTLVLTDPSTTNANVRFSNLSCGINARNSVLSMGNATFKDLYIHPNITDQSNSTAIFNEGYSYSIGGNSYTALDNVNLTNNFFTNFENLRQGFYQNRGVLKVRKTLMNNVNKGIYVSNSLLDDIDINLNQISAIEEGITSNRNDGASQIIMNQNSIAINNDFLFPNENRITGWGIALLERNLGPSTRLVGIGCNGISLNKAINGMYLSRINNATILENYISLNNSINVSGVYMSGSTNSILKQNSAESLLGTSNSNFGFLTSMSPENDFYNNSTNNTGIGFEFWNANAQINMIGNRIGTHYTGLHINKSGVIGPQILTSSNNSFGNRWFGYINGGSYGSGSGAINENNGIASTGTIQPLAPTYSRFFIDNTNNIGSLYYPNNDLSGFPYSSSGWFKPDPNIPPIIPSIITYCSPTDQERIIHNYSIYDSLVVQDRITASEFSQEISYISGRDLFEKLYKDSLLLIENEFFRAYYDSIANYNMGTLGQVSYLLRDLYKIDETTDSINKQIINDLETKIDRIKIINELFVNGNLSIADSTDLNIEGKYLVFEISKIKEQIGTLKKNLQTSINSKALTAMELNNSVAPNNLIETNEKYIDNFLLQDIVSPRRPNNEELATLVSIAIQCPFSGGRSVYTARNILYEYVPDLTYNDMDLCTAEGLMRKRNDNYKTNESSILISPNPATNFAKVIYLNDNDPIMEIQVLTVDGKLLLQQNNSLPFFVNSLNNGFYIVKCTTNNGLILSSKLNIVK